MSQITPGGSIIITGKEDIDAYRLLALKGALKLEIKGLKLSRGRSASQIIKREFGFKGNKESVLAQFESKLREMGVLID